MNMHVDTDDWNAFELVTKALTYLDTYKWSKENERLELAHACLSEAVQRDPGYLRAIYLNAMIDDLRGKANDAIPRFERVLEADPPFIEEVRYNLAVANYHRYSWPYLDKAVELFKQVLNNTEKETSLYLLAGAGLAQTYAMRMIPRLPTEADIDLIAEYYALAKGQYQSVMEQLDSVIVEDENILNEITWSIHNARGMSIMYYTDYFETIPDKINLLKKGLKALLKADEHSQRNWANYCDLGSVHMRLGHWSQSEKYFDKALGYLGDVIDELRPNYGFALYEIGRTRRLMGQFNEARTYLEKSEAIPYEYRDVGKSRLDLEKERASASSTDYP
jgi:tetratricopeptide (TPR) repeat protein